MFTVRRPDETADEFAPVDPTELVPLSALVVEGFGGDNARTPRDAIAALAAQLDGEVVLDDLGRRCVTREVARHLFSERAAAEVRQRKARERLDAQFIEQAAANPVWAGIPAGTIPDGVAPAAAMLAAAQAEVPRRVSVLEHALADRDGAAVFHPLPSVQP